MNFNFLISLVLFQLIHNTFQLDSIITAWNTTVATGYNGYAADILSIYYDTTYVYITTNSIPAYSIGSWPKNKATAQNYTYKFYLTPTNATTKKTVSTGAVGLWKDGVAIFNANNAASIGDWSQNAYYWEGNTFDSCKGHPQASGIYHNHVDPICMGGYSYNDSTAHSPLLGYMLDSYPIYGPFGYSSAYDSSSSIKRMISRYSLRNISTRTTYPNGTTTTSSGPSVNTTYPLGSFLYDYEYLSTNGDLDEYNGRWCVTPEYPSGTYAYFISLDSSGNPAYPFVIGYYYQGSVASVKNVTLSTSGLTKYYSST